VTATPSPAFEDLWLTEALRLTEEDSGPLEDAEANRQARAAGGPFEARLVTRARLLGQRDGLLAARRRWRQGALLAAWLLGIVALFCGAGLAAGALGDGSRPVNVFWALGSLLGLNLLSLLVWALGLLGGGRQLASPLARLWLWLSGRLARDARALHLGPALVGLLGRARLLPWALGGLVHGLWLLILGSALATLLALLSGRSYLFVWETTLLGSDTFVLLTQALGALPQLLGFPLPDPASIAASGDAASPLAAARQAWAGWLLGVVLVYGLLPRLLLTLLCLWRWRRGRQRLRLDVERPGYLHLRERLLPTSERLGVNDAAPAQLPQQDAGSLARTGDEALLVGIELTDHTWPPPLPEGVRDAGVLDDGQGRRHLLEQLTRYPARRLLIACDPRRSPDRGTLTLLAELSRCATATRVWLLPAPLGGKLDPVRLDDWRQALDALRLAHCTGDLEELAWLETNP